MTPIAMKHSPMIGTTRTENAPPVATAVPYINSQHPGSRAIRPIVTNTGVRIMPATSGGTNASAKRYAGAAYDNGAPDRRALIDIAVSAMATATAASANHTATHRSVASGGPEIAAARTAEIPIRTPPQPGTAVNALA